MTYQITHSLAYQFEPEIELASHEIRLQPRTDAYQTLKEFMLQIFPEPLSQTLFLDMAGNLVTRCWWPPQTVSQVKITAQSTVQTDCENPFNYLLEPWATHFPLDYPRSQFEFLSPYFTDSHLAFLPGSSVSDWAQGLLSDCQNHTTKFLSLLNESIYTQCSYQPREQGSPYPPAITWQRKEGTCRDFVVLFMAACSVVGLASRFVSGYEEGSPDHEQTLHAWVEVYLPGAGWRGYDPTLGLAVGDRHIALAAHRFPELTTPVSGQYRGNTRPTLHPTVRIQRLSH